MKFNRIFEQPVNKAILQAQGYDEVLRVIWRSDSTRNWRIYSSELTLRFWDDNNLTKRQKYAEEEAKAR